MLCFSNLSQRLLAAGFCFALTLGQAAHATGTRAIQNPPTHLGTNQGAAACDTVYGTMGFEPDDNQQHPLFLYIGGTDFGGNEGEDLQPLYDLRDATLTAMAERGYVSLLVEYDDVFDLATFNQIGFRNKLNCMFDQTSSESLISKACALSSVDCSQGIATWGMSQGAILALGASQYDSRIYASLSQGYTGTSQPVSILPFNRVRLVNGEDDGLNNDTTKMNTATGLDCASNATDCLRSDGSGWVVVRAGQVAMPNDPPGTIDHCWFFRTECGSNGTFAIEPNFWDPNNPPTYEFSLVTNADWLAQAAAQPPTCPAKYVALKSQMNGLYVSALLGTAGVPLKAQSFWAQGWETFACLEQGNGQIALQASNGKFVVADTQNGYALSATADQPGQLGTFTYVDLGSGIIALQGDGSNDYVDVKAPPSRQLFMDNPTLGTSAKFEIIAK